MAVACGEFHSVCLDHATASMWVMGSDRNLQLGLRTMGDRKRPVNLSLQNVREISCGADFTTCLDINGVVWTFGKVNDLGIGRSSGRANANIPKQISSVPRIISVQCGSSFTMLIDEEHSLWSFGDNTSGQLGTGDNITYLTPRLVPNSRYQSISCGTDHSVAIDPEGNAFSCGNNTYGKLGLGHERNTNEFSPIIGLTSAAKAASCGKYHSVVLMDTGDLYAIGSNANAQLGVAGKNAQNVPIQVPNLPPISQVSCGERNTKCVDTDGNLWVFGCNRSGSLGLGEESPIISPTKHSQFDNVTVLSKGCYNHSIIKDSTGIWVCGGNRYGELGLGHSTTVRSFVRLPDMFSCILSNPMRAKSARK